MTQIDMRTVIISTIISNGICALVVANLWVQNRKRFEGIGFWLVNCMMQFLAFLLLALRGYIPDLISMTGSTTLVIGGTILLYTGLERFVGRRGPWLQHVVLLAAFIITHAYFVFNPSLIGRNIVFSLAFLVICAQCAWLMFHEAHSEMGSIFFHLGLLFTAYCLINGIRIYINLSLPIGEDFFKENVYETFMVMAYQMLFIFLTFGLHIAVNNHLTRDLEADISARAIAEKALKLSEEKFHKAFQSSPDSVTITRVSDGQMVELNEGFSRISGYSREEAVGNSTLALNLWANPQERESFTRTLQEKNRISDAEFNFRSKSGEIINGRLSAELIQLDDQPHILSVIRDITERQQAEEIFQIRVKLFDYYSSHSLIELMQMALDEIGPITNSPISFYHFIEPDQKTIVLQAWSTRTKEEFCRAEGEGMHYPVDQAGVWTDCIRERKPVIHNDYASLPHRKGLPPGHADVLRELVVPILRNGQIVAILGVGNKPTDYNERDVQLVSYIADIIWEIVSRKRAEEKLQQLSRAVEQSPASIVITNTQGNIEYINPRFTLETGYTLDEAVGQNPRILKTDMTPRETYRELWEAIRAGQDWQGEFVNRKKNGEIYYELARISPILDEHGSIIHFVAVKENITERRNSQLQLQVMNDQLSEQIKENLKLQEILQEQAIRDPLTGLYNRRYLDETIGRELARAKREKYPVSFMMADIDDFKALNDAHGHFAGDAVLIALGDLFRTRIRQGDIACRYGGEEFLIILPHADAANATRRAEEIRHTFQDLRIHYNGVVLSSAISIGIAVYPQHGNNPDDLVRNADAALYKAKQSGRNRVWVLD